MSRGYTGGQYSLVRAATGLGAAVSALAGRPPAWGSLEAAAAVALAVGWHPRASAGLAALAHAAAARPEAGPAALLPLALTVGVYLIHACLPAAPFGSAAAIGRPDPAGGWRMPPWVPWAARLLACAAIAGLAAGRPTLGPALALATLGVDPGWIPAREPDRRERVFYDGGCGVCHGFVRFLLAEDDRADPRFEFAPLDGAAFARTVPRGERERLPDSVVVLRADRRLLVRSEAVRHVAARLGGLWRLLGAALAAVPRPLADRVYDAVAGLRRHLAPAPASACPRIPERLRARFDLDHS